MLLCLYINVPIFKIKVNIFKMKVNIFKIKVIVEMQNPEGVSVQYLPPS